MSSSFSCLAVLSLLALASCLPDTSAAATAAGGGAVPRGQVTAGKFLSALNDVRRQAGVPPLAWNATVALRAKQRIGWLRSSSGGGCDLRNIGKDPTWRRSGGGSLTYFMTGGTGRADPAAAVSSWESERRWYNRDADACVGGKQCGDYRNMVRRASNQVGCAVAVCASGQSVMVCEYYPFW